MLRPGLLYLLLGLAGGGIHGSAGADLATQLERADTLAGQGNFAPAYCIWRPLADEGNAEALFNLGWLYRNGDGVAADDERAVQLWEAAAEKGHAEAQTALGTLYSLRRSSPENRQRAVRWYTAAARQGDDDALLVLLEYADSGDQQALDAVTGLIRQGEVGKHQAIRVDKGNVRAKPSTSAKVLITLPRNSALLQLADHGDWIHVWVPPLQQTGWVFHTLLED